MVVEQCRSDVSSYVPLFPAVLRSMSPLSRVYAAPLESNLKAFGETPLSADHRRVSCEVNLNFPALAEELFQGSANRTLPAVFTRLSDKFPNFPI